MRRNPDPSDRLVLAAVHLEVCMAFDADPAEPGICAACGWLEDDHRGEEISAAA